MIGPLSVVKILELAQNAAVLELRTYWLLEAMKN